MLLGIRFCEVADQAEGTAKVLRGLGLDERDMGAGEGDFSGAVFPLTDLSWVETWPAGEGMPAGMMLQLVVSDADAYAAQARAAGLLLNGPVDAHGERIYYVRSPSGLSISFQSALPEGAVAEQ